MTEQEWETSTNVNNVLMFLSSIVSGRKLRLFACGCCRQKPGLLHDSESREAIEVAERFADGIERNETRSRTRRAARVRGSLAKSDYEAASIAYWILAYSGRVAAKSTSSDLIHFTKRLKDPRVGLSWKSRARAEELAQIQLLRDIVGNPFRTVTFDPRWRSSTVTALAGVIYEERTFEDLPILTDALEEAGCNHQGILRHCRSEGPHVRGCWVIDLILERD